MTFTRKAVDLRTRNKTMSVLEKWGPYIIEEYRYKPTSEYYVLDSDGDVYQYQPEGTPKVDKSPKERTGGNRGDNDSNPRIMARSGEMVKMFRARAKVRPLGKPNETNTETSDDKILEGWFGYEIAAYWGYETKYEPSTKNDGYLLYADPF
jgi:hypothetical protein